MLTVSLAALCLAGMAIVGVSAFAVGTRRPYRTGALDQMQEAIEAMSDGLGLYDASDRLIVWNAQYTEMNSEDAESLKSGMKLDRKSVV